MKDRRSFFKSLAMLAGMATITPAGLRLPATTPTKRELISKTFSFNPRDYAGKWTLSTGTVLILDAPTVYAIKPPEEQEMDMVFHLRES